MFKRNITTEMVHTNVIFEEPTFKRIWNRVITQRYFIEGVSKYGIYTRPTGYRANGKVFLLGHKSSLDAMIDLKEEEIEMDLLDCDKLDIVQFLIIFLSKEHKNLRCTREFIRVILEYINTPEGKVWFKSVLEKGDKEERLAHVLDISNYEVKCHLRLLKPGNEHFAKMLDTESLNAAIKACNEAEIEAGVRKPNNAGPKGVSKSPQMNAGSTTTPEDSTINNFGEPQESDKRQPAVERIDNLIDEILEEEPSDDFLQEKLAEYSSVRSDCADQKSASAGFITKVTAVLADDSQIELAGIAMLTVDGNEIKSTDAMVKQLNGNWLIPNYQTLFLTVMSVR